MTPRACVLVTHMLLVRVVMLAGLLNPFYSILRVV